MEIELRHLRLLSTVAEEGSLTKASNRLFLTQSALSHQLRDMESSLGVPLFQRISKKMILTPAGERLLRSASVVTSELRRATTEIKRISEGEGGVLRVSTECYTTYYWLPRMIVSLQKKFPSVDVQIVLEATRRPVHALVGGKVDIALVSSRNDNDSRLEYHPLFKDELVVIMSPDHELTSKSYIQAKDFAGQNLMLYDIPDEESTVLQEVLKPAGVTPARVTRIQLTEAKIELARAGWGIGVLARWAVAPQLRKGTLVARPLTRKGFHRQWYAATIRNELAPKFISEFISLLSQKGSFIESPEHHYRRIGRRKS